MTNGTFKKRTKNREGWSRSDTFGSLYRLRARAEGEGLLGFLSASNQAPKRIPPIRFSIALLLCCVCCGPAAHSQTASKDSEDVGSKTETEGADRTTTDNAPFADLLKGLEGIGTETSDDPEADGASDAAAPVSSAANAPSKADRQSPPLFVARQAMGEAVRLLDEDGAGSAAQSAQQQALDALDAFIEDSLAASTQASAAQPQPSQDEPSQQQETEMAAQEGDQQQGADQRDKQEGSTESDDTPGNRPGQAPEQAVDNVAGTPPPSLDDAVWGHLPQRLRQRLQATMPEEFLPAYEQAIRDYFTRLSEMSDADGR